MRRARWLIGGLVAVLSSGLAFQTAEGRWAFEQADALVRAGRCAEALPRLEAALRADPEFPDALFASGVCYGRVGKPAEAERALRRYISLEPRAADGRTVLGIVLLAAGRPADARTELVRALALDPSQIEATKALARAQMLVGASAEAVHLLRERSKAGAEDGEFQAILTEALAKSGDHAAAAATGEKLLTSQPRQTPAFYALVVNAFQAAGETGEAFGWCERGLALYPDSVRLESAYVVLPLKAVGKRLEERLRQANPNDADQLISLALLLSSVDRNKSAGAAEAAEKVAERALALAPDSPRAHYAYGRSLRVLRKDDQAIAELEKAAALAPVSELKVLAYTGIGVTETHRSRPEAAETAFRKAMEMNRQLPVHNGDAAIEFARFLSQSGLAAESLSVVEEILRWEPFFYAARMERAKALSDAGHYEAAAADAELVARNAIDDPQLLRAAHVLLTRTYHRLGRDKEARAHEAWVRTHQAPR